MNATSPVTKKLFALGVNGAIDAHAQCWDLKNLPPGVRRRDMLRPDLQREVLASDMVRIAHANGFSGSILVQARDGNEDAGVEIDLFRKAADEHPAEILGCIIGIDLRRPEDVSFFVAAAGQGMPAKFVLGARMARPEEVKPGDPDEHIYLDPKALETAHLLAAQRLALDLVVRSSEASQVSDLIHFVEALNGSGPRLIVNHLLRPEGLNTAHPTSAWKDTMSSLARQPNLWMKLSGLPGEFPDYFYDSAGFEPFLDFALDAFGPERLIFGSDHPSSWAMEDWALAVADWAERKGSKVDPVKLFQRNAVRAYGMPFA